MREPHRIGLDGPPKIGRSTPTAATGICKICQLPMPRGWEHAAAHSDCARKVTADAAGSIQRDKRDYRRAPSTGKTT